MHRIPRTAFRLCRLSFALCLLGGTAGAALAANPTSAEAVCSRSDVLFCEDWEDGDHQGWDWSPSWDSCTTIQNSGGFNSPNALKQRIPSTGPECGFPGTQGVSASVQTSPIFMRFYLKFSPGYKFMCTNAQKIAYLRSVVNGQSVWRNMLGMQARVGSDDLTNNICPNQAQGRITIDNGLHSQLWHFNGAGSETFIDTDRWYCIEWEMKGNTPGESDGSFKLWLDDQLFMSYSGVNLNSTGTPITMAPYLSHYYGGNPSPPHPAQDVWYDNIVTARSRIGCAGTSPAGNIPPGVTNVHRTDVVP